MSWGSFQENVERLKVAEKPLVRYRLRYQKRNRQTNKIKNKKDARQSFVVPVQENFW